MTSLYLKKTFGIAQIYIKYMYVKDALWVLDLLDVHKQTSKH